MDKVFRRAALKALFAWGLDDDAEELSQELWVWYLERPETRRKLEGLKEYEAVKTATLAAHQILSERILAGNTFNDRNLYSSEAVKDVLKGRSTNHYLQDILPIAMAALDKRQNSEYAEAIRRRYVDGVIPEQGKEAVMLSEAHKELTSEVNIIVYSADPDSGPGSRAAVFPDSCKPLGLHGDPTGNIAITLIENPEAREDFLFETPLVAVVDGAVRQPIQTIEGKQYRQYWEGNNGHC